MLTDKQLIAIRDECNRREPQTSAVHAGASYTTAELRFQSTMDRYKRAARRPFPKWMEVLAVLTAIGYRDCSEPDVAQAVEAAMARRAEALREAK